MKRLSLFAAAILTAATLTPVFAGPPLLCFPYQIGDAKSLPWGDDAFKNDSGYDTTNLARDTMNLLRTERNVLVRMETLRRAAIYIGQDARKATDLLARLTGLAMDCEATHKPGAINWFDAGFFAATIAQNGVDLGWHVGHDGKVDGMLYIRRACELDKNEDPAMQYGAALVAFHHDNAASREFLRRAVAGAKPGSDLAASIESNHAFGAKKLDVLRKELGDARADAQPK